jgi:hypothetical protein
VKAEALQRVALAMAQERHVGAVMRLVVQGIAEAEPEVALVRLWVVDAEPLGPQGHPSEVVRPEPTRCLKLVASAGRPRGFGGGLGPAQRGF